MKKLAQKYYAQGYNCSGCMLRAAQAYYGFNLPPQCYDMINGINTGFGVGGMCSVLIAAVMIFSILFGEEGAKRMRLKLLTRIQEDYKSINCSSLKGLRRGSGGCEHIIGVIAQLTEDIIAEEG